MGEENMDRYKEYRDSHFDLGSFKQVYTTAKEDAKTGNAAKGYGDTREEADKNAHEDLGRENKKTEESGGAYKTDRSWTTRDSDVGDSKVAETIASVIVGLILLGLVSIVSCIIDLHSPEKIEKRAKIQAKIEFEKPENVDRRMREKIVESLGMGGVSFRISDYFVLGNKVWASGHITTIGRDETFHYSYEKTSYPAVAYSEDNGDSCKIIFRFKEQDDSSHGSKIIFINKTEGFLLIGKSMGGSYLYKTNNGGEKWDIILFTRNMPGVCIYCIEKIKAENNKYIIGELFSPGCYETMESIDGGQYWTYKRNGRIIADTDNKGSSWRVKAGESIP